MLELATKDDNKSNDLILFSRSASIRLFCNVLLSKSLSDSRAPNETEGLALMGVATLCHDVKS